MATKIGFLSFGHYMDAPGSRVVSGQDALLQAIDMSVGAEEVGIDGAYFRVHHFARQHSAPFPLLAAVAARTKRIEIGTGVIDMRYENPLYMAEEAAVTDLISHGRLQLGVSRGSPEPALAGYQSFGYVPEDGDHAEMARHKTLVFLRAIQGAGVANHDPRQSASPELLALEPQSADLHKRIWWGAGSRKTAVWAAERGMNLMSSTLLTEDTGVPMSELQAEQIQQFRDAWEVAGHHWTPRVSVSRSIIPLVDDESRRYFGIRAQAEAKDQVGQIEPGELARFGRSYIGEIDTLVEELKADAAVQAADTLLVTVPNALGVDFNVRMLEAVSKEIRPALG